MRRSPVAVLVAVLLGLLAVVRPSFAGQPWNPGNPVHANAIKSFACEEDMFPRMSNRRTVRASNASPAQLVKFLERQGIVVSEADAAILLREVELTVMGRDPTRIRAADLITARRPGATGLHGYVAELEFVKADPERVNFSTSGSETTDVTIREADGRVKQYVQVKCRKTADASFEGVVENWIKFHAKDRGGGQDFLGAIPRDQFDQLVKEGILAPDGSVRDPAVIDELRAKINDRLPKYGAVNRGLLAKGLQAGDVHDLKFKPLDGTYDEYVKKAADHQAKSNQKGSPLQPPDRAPRRSTAAVGYGGAAALAILSFGQVRDMKSAMFASGESLISFLEQAREFSGRQKYQVQRAMQAVPKWLKPSMPKVSSIRTVGRFAAGAGAVIAVAFVAVDVYRYSSGTMSTREFTSSASQMAAGMAGGWLGAKAGLFVGTSIGSVIPGAGTAIGGAVGAFVGAVIGSFGGTLVASSATDAIWASFNEDERDYAIELILRRDLPP